MQFCHSPGGDRPLPGERVRAAGPGGHGAAHHPDLHSEVRGAAHAADPADAGDGEARTHVLRGWHRYR